MGQSRYLTLDEAAKDVGKPVFWVKDHICRGELAGKLEGRKWLVSVESLQKIVPTSSPPKPETVIHDFLTPRPPREAPANEKPPGQDIPAREVARARKPTNKGDVPVSGRKDGKAKPSRTADSPIPATRRLIEGPSGA